VCRDVSDLAAEIAKGAGTLLLAKEVLLDSNLKALIDILNAQPSWSDLPVIVLAGEGDLTEGSQQAIRVLRLIRNTTILERPVRVATLISVIESAVANRRRQYEVRDLVAELEQARKEAVRANKTKSDFLANMSHEIRTPLGVMLGFAEFANDDRIGHDDRKRYLGAIEKNGRILLDLVNDILDLSKVEAGRIAIENVEVAIQDLLHEVMTSLEPRASAKGVLLDLRLSSNFPQYVISDPTRIRQVFLNIVGNAVKFTDNGSVVCEGFFETDNDGNSRIRLRVTDTGVGIAKAHAKNLFKPFTQADNSMARKFGGTGLGLVLSRKLARALGGDLNLVVSEPGRGSTFEISFQAQAAEGEHQVPAYRFESDPSGSIAGLNVLVADDSEDNQFIISRILKHVGIEVETADNGEEAVSKASSGEYDIVLMDIQMPRMDGNEATQSLRKKGYRRPIIALTANALKSERDRALNSGFDDYITKPIEKKALYESLRRFDPR
jgi:signal transduction histidine kinase